MAVEFRLPDLGEGITEGELVRWLVKPGDHVALDQALADVQTDKAVVQLPSPVAGTVLALDVAEGQVVPVDTLLLTITDESEEAIPATRPAGASTDDASGKMDRTGTGAAPAAHAAARPPAVAPSEPRPDGAGRWSEASVAPQRRVLATPAVRRLARELGVAIATIAGSGPAGRVLAEDVRAAVAPAATTRAGRPSHETTGAGAGTGVEDPLQRGEATRGPMEPAQAPGASGRPWDGGTQQAEAGPAEERLPLRGLRRRIAENMVLSASTIPQVTSLVEVDATGLVAARRAVLTAAEGRGVKLSYLPFIVKALVQALRAYPYVNAAIDDTTREIVLKRHYHIGIATATPDGLLVPVLRHADRLTMLEIAAELNRLAEQARARALPLEELRGSTCTISNYGAVGGFFATPIINPGEAAILGLGRIVERPWVVDGQVEARPVLPLSFTADHRLIDGELAMRFLNTLIATLENPTVLLLDMR